MSTDAEVADESRQWWNDRYTADGNVFGADANRFVEEFASGLAPGTALDLGCGQGRNSVWLAQQGHTVHGVDISTVAVAQATSHAIESGVAATFEAAELSSWEPPKVYDLVVLSYLQLVPEIRVPVHATAQRCVAAGGRLLLIAHHADNLERGVGGPQRPDVLFREEQLAIDFAELAHDRLGPIMRPVESEDGVGNAIDIVLLAHRP